MNESMPSSAQPPHAAQNPRIWLLLSEASAATCAFGDDAIGGGLYHLGHTLVVCPYKEVNGHRGADHDHKRANPTLWQPLRIMRGEISATKGAGCHHYALL